ncbi:polysaccharide pyruvyl transferase CsaB [Slackia heliotrinireducens]|uniref:Polysaccharide pyruvyl transferase domain-containing protein n=1 Tax=Slackia heliotrinireducens (strain ATCC 29202 / DSM 20476 / NCTC 11029 / RHS 1) TaxID=471855 RepID=C7N1U7_SLAHD|nr:hypothetical protein [Slackia heliotrinireducens]ACV23388.1 hypothetical protein Shel_23790 [Slackia heliotrinireducens DSM 20476]VEH02666.1 polysaccharide pyruvyl transferase CsaB [Slackia heliotrinireducens]
MDRILALIVRFCAFLGRFTNRVSYRPLDSHGADDPLKILLVGYNGARNTGSDVRVASLITQLNDEFGSDRIRMSLMSLDPSSTEPYLAPNVDAIPFDTMFFLPLLKACSTHEVIILCEGSMLKSKFANGLTLFMCEAAGIAKAQHKPCIAYGGEAGDMDAFVSNTARKLCTDAKFIARTEGSREAMRQLGFEAELGTDTAWTFDGAHASEKARDLLVSQGWNGTQPLLGIAVINPFCWPAKPSLGRLAKSALTGTWEQHYQKWYFFSWSEERARAFETYLQKMAQAVEDACAKYGFFPVIIGMEKLDLEACTRLGAMTERPHASILSNNQDGYVISEVIGMLSRLATSRYHAAVLAIKQGICPIGVSMDERLQNLFEDAGISKTLLLSVNDPALETSMAKALDEVSNLSQEKHAELSRYVDDRRALCRRMAVDTKRYLAEFSPLAHDLHLKEA